MNNKILDIKYHACLLCDAMVRNINENFSCISFEILSGGDVQVQVILDIATSAEYEYIDDLMAEFTTMQQTDCVKTPKIEIGRNRVPLKNIVFRKA
jgi:hypothetical protein